MPSLFRAAAPGVTALTLGMAACADDSIASAGGQDTSSGAPVTAALTDEPTPPTASATDTAPTTADTGAQTTTTGDPTTITVTGDTTTPGTLTDGDSTATTDDTTGDCFSCSEDNTQVLCDGALHEQCTVGSYCVDAACKPLSPCEATELFKSSEGCEYYAVKSELLAQAAGSCFAAFIANTGDEPVKLRVEYDGQELDVAAFTRIPQGQGLGIEYQPYDAAAGLPVGEVAILFLSRGTGGFPKCPTPAGIQMETHVVGTGLGKAFRISTDHPVAAYQMLPYGGGSVSATSATLLLPTSVWDTNYIAINAYPRSQVDNGANPLFIVVAAEDDTEITLDPKVAVVGGAGVQGGPAGVPIRYTLGRGQTLQISQPDELTGSPLAADKPIGMFGGASCLNVPVAASACDGAHQQIPPVKALGSAYAAVRYRNRANLDESPPWRLVGAVADTKLTWIPNRPVGAPDTLTLGQVAEFNSPGPFLVSSQGLDHPFYVAAYMTGGQPFNGTGDPEWVNVIPTAQYLKEYVLFTDPTYPDTSLVVVRNRRDGVFADVELTCAGKLGGWTPLGADQEWTRIDLVKGNFMDQGDCSNGRHEMASANPFGVTVWGWGSTASNPFNSVYVSYAYPAGAAIKSINDVVVLPQ